MKGHKGWPSSTIVDGIPDIESVEYALRHTKYGQCIYESDNDVCDNQVCTKSAPISLPNLRANRWST